jgi:diaminopimelate decarboxylase
MHHFRYAGQNLHCESVDLAEVAKLYGTPTYVYSAATIADNYTRLAGSMKGVDVRVCFAVKANANLAVLRHLGNLAPPLTSRAPGRCAACIAAGASVKESVFAGVGKTEAEIRLALEAGFSRSTSRASPSSPGSTTLPASWA